MWPGDLLSFGDPRAAQHKGRGSGNHYAGALPMGWWHDPQRRRGGQEMWESVSDFDKVMLGISCLSFPTWGTFFLICSETLGCQDSVAALYP